MTLQIYQYPKRSLHTGFGGRAQVLDLDPYDRGGGVLLSAPIAISPPTIATSGEFFKPLATVVPGTYNASPEATLTYQWYLALDPDGTVRFVVDPVTGNDGTETTWQVVPSENTDKYYLFTETATNSEGTISQDSNVIGPY